MTWSVSPAPSPHGLSRTELIRLSRDALRRADGLAQEPADAVAVPVLAERLGLLVELLEGVLGTLATASRQLQQREQAGTVAAPDGVFTGDPEAALSTVNLWSGRASAAVVLARDAVDNAHVAAGGLADVPPPRTRRPR